MRARGLSAAAAGALTAAMIGATGPASADHSWGSYHWERIDVLSLALGDNVDAKWKSPTDYFGAASDDWSQSEKIATTIVTGGANPKNCRPTSGRVEVCSSTYGFNGWLGLAQIWISGGHITQGIVKINDSYFNLSTYDTFSWRSLVMCQEVGHTFGLDHQDEDFYNDNLYTCMDYAADPTGNEHPNDHDYEQLAIIYQHTDEPIRVVGGRGRGNNRGQIIAAGSPSEAEDAAEVWGRAVAFTSKGQGRLFVKELSDGRRIITHVLWTEDAPARRPR